MAVPSSLRIAVEGCGHGTLDAIYASVKKSCEVKGWDGIDLLIICGDFQAVRNHADLNMTAMPAHFHQMGDFHQYYHGTKLAPYLTVFIGGNHEASNHLFELHYGGWAAPNIYYLGAANVIKVGPLKIASTSGTYKRYDYQKPHFERLPYNDSNIRSIYHQRELDIRKLLSYRTQVDIGLSHDWPSGIEWFGDHRHLFKMKPHFREEAEAGEFGSKPSAQVLDRLRPSYWFSAHHHFKYTAYKVYNDSGKNVKNSDAGSQAEHSVQAAALAAHQANRDATTLNNTETRDDIVRRPGDVQSLSAWTSFKDKVQENDAADDAREEEARKARLEERKRTGQDAIAGYKVEETFKEVNVGQSNGALHRQSQPHATSAAQNIPQVDGTCCSVPKRRRKSSPSDEIQPSGRPRLGAQVDGPGPDSLVANPDAIEVDLSDSESENEQRPLIAHGKPEDADQHAVQNKGDKDEGQAQLGSKSRASSSTNSTTVVVSSVQQSKPSDPAPTTSVPDLLVERSVEGKSLNGTDTMPNIDTKSTEQNVISTNGDNARLDTSLVSQDVLAAGHNGDAEAIEQESEPQDKSTNMPEDEIPEDIRAQLAEMSSTFAPQGRIEKSADLPFPAQITNTATRFLALSKVEKGRHNEFLQLLEIEPHSPTESVSTPSLSQPHQLQYDPEWLAITRVFANELTLGGTPKDKIPPDQGQTHYRERIVQEEKWVQENIVSKGLLVIPKNFQVQIEAQDFTNLSKEEKAVMPRELTNPQTSEFCKLLDIPNPFDISEEERDARMAQGPPSDDWVHRNGGGGGRSRGGRGGRGGGGRGRGRGGFRRGRGRGHN